MFQYYSKLLYVPLFLMAVSMTVSSPLRAQDGTGMSYYVEAEKLRQRGNLMEAVDMYNAAIRDDGQNFKFYFQKAKCYLAMRDEDNALVGFEKSVELNPEYIHAYTRLAWLYQRRDKLNKAINALDMAFKYEERPENRIEYKAKIVDMLYKLNRQQEAGTHIQDALDVDGENLQMLYYHARYSNEHGQYEIAQKAMKQAISLIDNRDPKFISRFYYELGYAYHHMKQYELAKEALDVANFGDLKNKVVKMTPAYNYAKAKSYFQIYDYTTCQALIDLALTMDPGFSPAYNLQIRLAELHTDKATMIEHTEKSVVVEEDPIRKASKFADLTEMYLYADNFSKAIENADSCISLQPNNYEVAFIKAIAYQKMDDLETAKEELHRLRQYHRVDFETKAKFNFALGLIAHRLDDDETAINALKSANYGSFRHAALAAYEALTNNQSDDVPGLSVKTEKN